MIREYTITELCGMIQKDLQASKEACWYFTAHVMKFEDTDRERFIVKFLDSDFTIQQDNANWSCSLILHTLPWVSDAGIKKRLSDALARFLLCGNELVVAYAGETVARANYLLDRDSLKDIVRIMETMDFAKMSEGTLQNMAIMGWSLYDFVLPFEQCIIREAETKLESLLGYDLYRMFKMERNAGVAFYVSDFLSGKSFLQPPIAELYSATMLKKMGVDSFILDNRIYHLNMDHIMDIFGRNHVSTIVVDTTPYDQVSIYYVDYRLNRIIYDVHRLKEAGFRVILIGSHISVRPDETFKVTGADFGIVGEPEVTLCELCRQTKAFSSFDDNDLEMVPNLYINGGRCCRVTFTDLEKQHPDISGFPVPDYDFLDMKGYYGDEYYKNEHKIRMAWGAVLAQRGCPYQCAFCYNFFSRNVRKRTPQQVVTELELLEKKYHVEHVFFVDNTFTLDHRWVSEVCRLIREKNLKICWNCETRVDCLTPEILAEMKSANCHRIWLGAESFNDSILINANKKITREQTIRVIKDIFDSGIKVSCFLMIGIPGETRETIRNTLRTIVETGIEYTKSIITLIPRDGTRFFEMVEKRKENPGFYDMNCYKGILENQITEADIIETIEIMSRRDLKEIV